MRKTKELIKFYFDWQSGRCGEMMQTEFIERKKRFEDWLRSVEAALDLAESMK